MSLTIGSPIQIPLSGLIGSRIYNGRMRVLEDVLTDCYKRIRHSELKLLHRGCGKGAVTDGSKLCGNVDPT